MPAHAATTFGAVAATSLVVLAIAYYIRRRTCLTDQSPSCHTAANPVVETVPATTSTSVETAPVLMAKAPTDHVEDSTKAEPQATATAVAPADAAAHDAGAAAEALAAAAKHAERIEAMLGLLKPTEPGSEVRRRLVIELLEALEYAASCKGKAMRVQVRAFVDGGGPELVYELESSMTGNWVLDAKNGTLKHLSSMSRLPGAIGQAIRAHRRVAEKNKLDAAHHLGCEHGTQGGEIYAPRAAPPPAGMRRSGPPS